MQSVSPVSLWRIVWKRQKSRLPIVLMGIADYLTSLYSSCAIICGCPSQVPHRVPLTEFVSSLIPAAVEECCFSPPGWLVLTVRASQWLLKDNQGFGLSQNSNVLIWAQHITYLFLPSLSTWLNIVTSLMNYVSLTASHSHFVSLALVSFTPSAFQVCFTQSSCTVI